jgi:hypothetical protein
VSRNAFAALWLLALIGFGLWYGVGQHKASPGKVVPDPAAFGADQASPRATASHAGTAKSIVVAPAASTVSDYAKVFREATNYRNFILSALPAAQNGDRDAQYYLSAALAYCAETNRFFFQRRERTLSVDGAIAERAAFPGNDMTGAIRRAYGRCHEVNAAHDPAWGTSDQWLAKASDAGQPVAQVRTATDIFLRIVTTGAAEVPKSGSSEETRNLSDARSLVRAAVESKNPEVIFETGDLLGLLNPELSQTESYHEALTWRYVACLRGLDCSASAEWLLQLCLSDATCLQDESGIDYLRRSAQTSHMVDLEEKANSLNDKIDAQAWDQLGLGG